MQAESLAITRTLSPVCSGIVFAKACTGQSVLRPGPTRIRPLLADRQGGSQSSGELCGQERRNWRGIRGIRGRIGDVTSNACLRNQLNSPKGGHYMKRTIAAAVMCVAMMFTALLV
jgi:hypothetical protein